MFPAGFWAVIASTPTIAAALEVGAVPTDSAAAAVRYVVLGTVLVEPLLLTLRRMAHQELSARRFR